MAAIDELREIYTNEGVCVFTGAGVSFTASERYKAETPAYDPDKPWWNLLADIHQRIHKHLSEDNAKKKFEKLIRSEKGDELNEWDVAEKLCRQAGSKKRFTEILILDQLLECERVFTTVGVELVEALSNNGQVVLENGLLARQNLGSVDGHRDGG